MMPAYRFKWSNYDLEHYLQERRSVAGLLRRDAAMLVARAEQIEEEAHHLQTALQPVVSGDLNEATDPDPARP